ncbi:MAG: hypothetical protein ABSD29_18955 [Verrucomicrobiota bacterium]|jgi:hypothetical protein
MNLKIKTQTFRLTTAAGLLLCTAVGASAAGNSIVTFSVDVTAQVQSSAFIPGTSVVYARGNFNGWGTSPLTNNPVALNTNIYSGTYADTADANGSAMQYKYYIDTGANWENPANNVGGNRTWGLPKASGGSLVLPTYYFSDTAPTGQPQVTNSITFQVDLTQQIVLGNFIPGTSHVYARGSFNDWGNDNTATSPFPLTNNPAAANTNLYTGVFIGPTGVEGGEIDNYGSIEYYKYYIDTGTAWDQPSAQNSDSGDNRAYNLLEINGALVLPAVYFSDLAPVPPVTNVITFQVDMSVQAALGRFTPPPNGIDYVQLFGSFNNWTAAIPMTNNPPPYTNKYSCVVTQISNPGTIIQYKFWDDTYPGYYEEPSSTGGGNRSVSMLSTNGSIVIPDVYFSDQTLVSVVSSNTEVTFNVDMTGAVEFGTTTPFDPSSDNVYINGDWLGWWSWRTAADNLGPGPYQLVNSPVGTSNYTITLQVPAANALALTYKYSIGGADNEAGFAQNHVRYVRTIGNYTMATDTFGNQYNEPAWGQLAIGGASGGHTLVSWLGLPGVSLETKTNLTGGSWTNLSWTDGTAWTSGYLGTNGFVSTTNYPTTAPQTFMRLIQPAAPPPAP